MVAQIQTDSVRPAERPTQTGPNAGGDSEFFTSSPEAPMKIIAAAAPQKRRKHADDSQLPPSDRTDAEDGHEATNNGTLVQ